MVNNILQEYSLICETWTMFAIKDVIRVGYKYFHYSIIV